MPAFLQPLGALPWWLSLVLLIPAALYGLLFLAVPFSVFGVKSRLESIEASLDLLHEEIRSLSLRSGADAGAGPDRNRSAAPPPIPPYMAYEDADLPRMPAEQPPRRPRDEKPGRSEPRLDWPRR